MILSCFTILNMVFIFDFPLDKIFSIYNLLFIFGIVSCVVHEKMKRASALFVLVAGVVLFLGTWFHMVRAGEESSTLSTLAYGLGSAMITCGAAALERAGKIRVPGFLRFLGDASYSIYLVHFPVISLLCKAVIFANSRYPIPDFCSFFLVAAGAGIAGILFHVYVETPLIRLCRRMELPRRELRQV